MIDRKRICTVVMKNEVTAVLHGLSLADSEYLVSEYSEFVPGYQHMPQFQLGGWDGKTKFVTKTGRTYQVFLPELIDFIHKSGYKLQLRDDRPPTIIDVPLVDESQFAAYGWTHRTHQVKCINAIITNNHRGIIVACTGAGKTAIVAGLAHAYHQACNFRSLVIVPSNDLVLQTLETYHRLGLDAGGLHGGSNDDLNYTHIVSTWQTLKNYPAKMLGFQVVVCDELQGAKSPIVSSLLIQHGAHIPVRIGCTGTMPKAAADYMTIYAAIGEKEVVYVTAVELQKQGYLATLHINQLLLQDTVGQEVVHYHEYSQEVAALSAMKDRDQFIADFILSLATQNTLVLVPGVALGKRLKRILKDRCVFIYGADKTAVRQQVYNSFEGNNDILAIANVQIAAVGLSIDRIFNLVLIDVGKAFTRVIQAIGRGVRVCEDKTHVEVYDIGTNYTYGANHANDRLGYYREAQYPYTVTKFNYRRMAIPKKF